jgi:polysaccharide biosynthesis protein PelE
MKLLFSIPASFVATVLDFGALFFMLHDGSDPVMVAFAIGLHAIAAVLAAAAVQVGAPRNAAASRAWFAAFAFVLALFVPFVGPLGLQIVVRAGLAAKRRDEDDPWTALDVDEALAERRIAVKRRGVTASKIQSLLGRRTPEEAERRFQAILQVKHLPANQQIHVLKFALKDPSDEVRLFAFSRIEKFRSDLEVKIKEFTADLESAHADDRAILHLRLAESFHEIAYLSLAEGAVLAHALEQAKTHALRAKELRPASGPADYILGRILLRTGEYDAAIQMFQSAVRERYPRVKVLPYMAECAFRQRRFDVMQTMLREIERVAGNANPIESLVEFWR